MIADLKHLFHDLESAYFFVIPILLCFALGGKKIFNRIQSFNFLIIAAITVIFLRIICFITFNKLTGRYHLPEVIILACFAPAGVYFLAEIIQKGLIKIKVKPKFELIIALLMIAALTTSSIKSLRITPKIFLKKFAAELKPYDSSETALIMFSGSGTRINARLSGKIKLYGLPIPNRNTWEGFFYLIEDCQFKYKNIFVMTRQNKNTLPENNDFEKSVRSYYMFFPFDLISQYNYKKKSYLLYRFNYKIADGISCGVTMNEKKPLNIKFPDTFSIPAGASNYKFNLKNYCPEIFNPENFYFNFSIRGMSGKYYKYYLEFSPEKNKIYEKVTLDIDIYNQILWPLKKKRILISYSNDGLNALPCSDYVENQVKLKNAIFKPPLNLPEKIYMLPENRRIFADGFGALPLSKFWKSSFYCNKKIASKGYIDIPGSNQGEAVELKVELDFLPLMSKNTGNTTIEIVPEKILNKPPQINIFMLNGNNIDTEKKKVILRKTLNKYGLNSKIISSTDILSSNEHFGYWDAFNKFKKMENEIVKHPQILKKKFDFVLINFDNYDFYRRKPWRIESEAKKMLDDLEKFILKVKEAFPVAKLGITIKPAPVPGISKHWSNHWFMQKLIHYSLCQGLYKRFNNRETENIYLIPLFHNIDPEEDYIKLSSDMRKKGIEYLSIMGLNNKGMQKKVNSQTAWIMYMLSSSANNFK
jgi:hypothetical protein